MAWLAVDKEGFEWIFSGKPHKSQYDFYSMDEQIELPKGTIKKLIGRDLTWDDDSVELT